VASHFTVTEATRYCTGYAKISKGWRSGTDFDQCDDHLETTLSRHSHVCNLLYLNDLSGGESGIRTLVAPLESASCRFYIASVAVNASDAVGPCTPLHPRLSSRVE
jgi:hypothetical protein